MAEDKEVDNQKEITLTPALTGLLKPTTKLLGQELKSFVKQNIDKIKEHNRERNLQYHLEKIDDLVQENEPINISEGENDNLIKNAEKLLESLETIQDVDPSEKELSEIWQNLVASLRLGKNVPQHLVDALKNVSPLEASILIEINRQETTSVPGRIIRFIGCVVVPVRGQINIEGADRHYLEVLKDKRLLVKTHLVEYFWGALAAFIVAGYFIYSNYYVPSGILDTYVEELFLLMSPIIFLMFLMMILMPIVIHGMSHGYGRYRLSWLGRKILRYAPGNIKRPNKTN